MKIIEGMKLRKELQEKAEDLREKIQQYCVHMDVETPTYGGEQKTVVEGWIQAHQDIVKKMRELSIALQRTNLATRVKMQLGGKDVELSIAEWILRRRELAQMEQAAWAALGDRNLKDGVMNTSAGTQQPVKVVRYYDPRKRDEMVDLFKHEPGMIDRTLEVVNATTDLLEK